MSEHLQQALTAICDELGALDVRRKLLHGAQQQLESLLKDFSAVVASTNAKPLKGKRTNERTNERAKAAPSRPARRSLPDEALSESVEEEIARVVVALQKKSPLQPGAIAAATKLSPYKVGKRLEVLVTRGRVSVVGNSSATQVYLGKAPKAPKEGH